MALNEKQKAFVDYYIETLNATESYLKAYGEKTSRKTAEVNASKLLKRDDVKEYAKALFDDKSKERIASQDEILEFITDVMRNDFKKLGYNKPLYIKDRLQASELLGKRYALFTEKIDINSVEKVVFVDDLDELED